MLILDMYNFLWIFSAFWKKMNVSFVIDFIFQVKVCHIHVRGFVCVCVCVIYHMCFCSSGSQLPRIHYDDKSCRS